MGRLPLWGRQDQGGRHGLASIGRSATPGGSARGRARGQGVKSGVPARAQDGLWPEPSTPPLDLVTTRSLHRGEAAPRPELQTLSVLPHEAGPLAAPLQAAGPARSTGRAPHSKRSSERPRLAPRTKPLPPAALSSGRRARPPEKPHTKAGHVRTRVADNWYPGRTQCFSRHTKPRTPWGAAADVNSRLTQPDQLGNTGRRPCSLATRERPGPWWPQNHHVAKCDSAGQRRGTRVLQSAWEGMYRHPTAGNAGADARVTAPWQCPGRSDTPRGTPRRALTAASGTRGPGRGTGRPAEPCRGREAGGLPAWRSSRGASADPVFEPCTRATHPC